MFSRPWRQAVRMAELNPLAHGLEGVADEKVHRRQGHRQAGDAQKGGPQGTGLRLRDKQMEDLGGRTP